MLNKKQTRHNLHQTSNSLNSMKYYYIYLLYFFFRKVVTVVQYTYKCLILSASIEISCSTFLGSITTSRGSTSQGGTATSLSSAMSSGGYSLRQTRRGCACRGSFTLLCSSVATPTRSQCGMSRVDRHTWQRIHITSYLLLVLVEP